MIKNEYEINKSRHKIQKCSDTKDLITKLSKDIIFKPKNKINEEDFEIPSINNYKHILENNYNVKQLKDICKKYNLQISGNKSELRKRLYNSMYIIYNVIYIQKIYRKIIVKNYIFLHGPGFYNRSLCTNDVDFISLDKLEDIPYTQFFSFKDDNKHIYGFDILSIYNLYKKTKNNFVNPFSTRIISKNISHNIFNYIKYSNILKLDTNISYDDINNLSESKKMEMKVLNLFQIMDSYGNYTNISWFKNLNKYDMIKFIRELYDIWSYRANLTYLLKSQICPPNGNPFSLYNINHLDNFNEIILKKYIINIIESLITKGITYDDKVLGTMYVLTTFTLVSDLAADAMPWLYDSANIIN